MPSLRGRTRGYTCFMTFPKSAVDNGFIVFLVQNMLKIITSRNIFFFKLKDVDVFKNNEINICKISINGYPVLFNFSL